MIQELKERDDIVIKPADKGSAVVVMDKVSYLEEANRQLTDERFYKKLDSDPTEEFGTKITQELKIMKENSYIDKNTFDYLKPDKLKVGRFYLLPKIHKVNNPGRPIVSANGNPTEKISEFVDFHLRSHVEALPLSRHLRSTDHHDSFGKQKVTIIDHDPNWDDKSRQERESFWIRKLKTLSPNGINEKK